MAAQEREVLVGQNRIRGGSRERAAKDWQAKPTGASASSKVVMTVMPVQNWPSTLRKARASISGWVIASLALSLTAGAARR
ncbi:hypothetical protein NONI108955_39505 [Nocardia ninae]